MKKTDITKNEFNQTLKNENQMREDKYDNVNLNFGGNFTS